MNRNFIAVDGDYLRAIMSAAKTNTKINNVSYAKLLEYVSSEAKTNITAGIHSFQSIKFLDYSNKRDLNYLQFFYTELMDLSHANVTQHYIPANIHSGTEKGVDNDLATEAMLRAANGEFEEFVLLSGDQDHAPLMRKMNSLGITTTLVFAESEKNKIFCSQYLRKASSNEVDITPFVINEKETRKIAY